MAPQSLQFKFYGYRKDVKEIYKEIWSSEYQQFMFERVAGMHTPTHEIGVSMCGSPNWNISMVYRMHPKPSCKEVEQLNTPVVCYSFLHCYNYTGFAQDHGNIGDIIR